MDPVFDVGSILICMYGVARWWQVSGQAVVCLDRSSASVPR